MKRSNRLVLLVGVFLAIVAFVGILLIAQGPPSTPRASAVPTTGNVVVATVDIPLSTRIRADQITTKIVDLTAKLPGAFTDTSQVVGQIARQPVATGAQVTSATLSGGVNGTITTIQTPLGLRSIAVRVDQNTGVGTAIKTGDYVDMIIGLTADKFPVITIDPTSKAITVVSGLNSTSVKVLLQGLQVVGTLLPPVPPPTTSAGASASPPPSTGGGPISLNDQQEIVILAGTAQQAEVIKFAQMDSSITLVLRSPDDFIDPLTGAPLPPVTTETTGVILKTLVDSYGVLAPELVQTVTPTATRRP